MWDGGTQCHPSTGCKQGMAKSKLHVMLGLSSACVPSQCPLPSLLDPVLRVTPLQSAQSDFCHPISQSHPTLQLPGIHSHTFNPLFAFNAFSRAVSTTVAQGQERKSPSGMVGTRPVQSPPQHCFHNGFFCPGIQFWERLSTGVNWLLNAACRARFTLAGVPAFLCVHTRVNKTRKYLQAPGSTKPLKIEPRSFLN